MGGVHFSAPPKGNMHSQKESRGNYPYYFVANLNLNLNRRLSFSSSTCFSVVALQFGMYIYVHGNVEINALHRIFKNTTATNNHCLFTTFTENDADDDPPIPSLSAAAAAGGASADVFFLFIIILSICA